MIRVALSSLILLLGLSLAAGGIWLAALGGSWAYSLIGLLLFASAVLLFVRSPVGLALYGGTLIVTLVWSVWEVGLDWWALAPRGGLLILLGALLLLPAVVDGLHGRTTRGARYGASGAILASALAVCVAVGLYSMFREPHEIAGAFTSERMAGSEKLETGVPPGEWHAYGRTSYGQRYSPLDRITPENIGALEVAWTYHTGQVRGADDPGETTYEVTPLIVNDTMYLCTPFATVIALDPVTGEERWRFDPKLKQPPTVTTQHMTCRGVTYFDGSGAPPRPDAEPGSPPQESAAESTKPLENRAVASQPANFGTPAERVQRSAAEVTTDAAGVPQNVVTDLAPPDAPNPSVDREPAGRPNEDPECVRRLFLPTSDGRLISISAETGHICPGFGGADGTVNLWANMPNVTPGSHYSTSPPVATDRLVIVGGTINDNASVTSPSGVIRAFDAFTGELVWNFDPLNPDQLAPIANDRTYTANAPNSWSVSSYDPQLGLVYVPVGTQSPDQWGGARSEASERFTSSVVALNAASGRPEWVFQTTHHDIWDYDVPAQPSLVDLTIDGQVVPALVQPTKQGEVFVLDRRTGKPLLPVKEVPVPQNAAPGDRVAPTQPVSTISFGPESLRESDMWGATLVDQLVCRVKFRQLRYEGRYTPPSLQGTIVYPGNFGVFNWGGVAVDPERDVMFGMPVYLAFVVKLVPRDDKLERVVTKPGEPIINENFGAPFAVQMAPFFSALGLPCQQPPWGYVVGVDLRTGKTVYRHVNGTVRDLAPVPLPFEMGVPGIGGPIVTKGGVAFLSGTLDYYVRGYDLRTGAEIWRARLPAGGQATPSTYLGRDGRQYLVVVAGGHGSTGTKAGDAIVAYALPKN
ncbi:MAG TPA: PQQ-binding-like beta-propeller repeat protein [Xanthobacteraceae bacterium]|nr:PQQ-binding-like beta-propeller repeat protein [Xanthobacteraceae bacterium]